MLSFFTTIKKKRNCSAHFTIFLTPDYIFCRTPYKTQQECCRIRFGKLCSKHQNILNVMLLPQIIQSLWLFISALHLLLRPGNLLCLQAGVQSWCCPQVNTGLILSRPYGLPLLEEGQKGGQLEWTSFGNFASAYSNTLICHPLHHGRPSSVMSVPHVISHVSTHAHARARAHTHTHTHTHTYLYTHSDQG